jgi:hypothetical protein
MATILKEISLDADADLVWSAVRDVGAVHTRLVPGVVTDTRLDGDARVVTFANGLVARERLVTIDDAARRLAYAAVGGLATHHNASMQVLADGPGRSHLVWVADLLPDALAGAVGGLMDQGATVMKRTLERRAAA